MSYCAGPGERGTDVLASSLNIQLRKSDYAGLAVICSCLGLAAACWFATGLLGITLLDIAKSGAISKM